MALITISEVKTFLTIISTEHDLQLAAYIEYASKAIESYCGRVFEAGSVTEFHDGGKSSIFVDKLPINNVSLVGQYSGSEYIPLVGSNLANGELPNVTANANAVIGYIWYPETGEISKDTGAGGGFRSLDITYPPVFNNFPKGVKVTYNGGYSIIPNDLKLAAANYVKMLHKQDQGTASFSFAGENRQQFALVDNFPPHIKRILDLYKIW